MSKQRTITLTNARPVRIDEDAWPEIASALWHDGQVRSQANREASVRVREHDDGRRIVYGVYSSNARDARDLAGGYLLAADAGDDALIAAIRRVAEEIGKPEMAAECIADLPAVDVDSAGSPGGYVMRRQQVAANVSSAIERSVSHNEIVTIDGGPEECGELIALCDDSAESSYDRGPDLPPGELYEFWGRDEEANEWRVHVKIGGAS